MERVLAFGCHPDDVEFLCAGTLALLAQKGYEVHIATTAGGEMGSPVLPPQQIRAKRLAENEASAKLIGGHFHWAGGHDIEIDYSPELRRETIRIMREVDPAIVFTQPPTDYMMDHEVTSKLVMNAAYIASCPNYDCGVPTKPTNRVPHLYYWNANGLRDIFGRPLPIKCVVDVGSVMDTKTEMLSCHASQREWLLHHDGWDQYLDNMKDMTRQQGALIGVEWGEGFIQHLGAGYPQDNILKTVLRELCFDTP